MADRDNYRGYGNPSGRYSENREYGQGYGSRDRDERSWMGGGREADRHRGEWRSNEDRHRGDNDRGFFEKAGEEIRSWFGDDNDRDRDRGQDPNRDRSYGQSGREPWGGGDRGGQGYGRGQHRSGGYETGGSHPHDDHYRDWRQEQISALDRDYEEYRRENRDRFNSEFSTWRGQRQQQRTSMGQVREHMDVLGSDGSHLGTVDKVAGDRIILAKNDQATGGHHHSIPCSWIQSVDGKVTVNMTAEQAKQQWQDEDNRHALFEKGDQQRGAGAHMLNRSFSGTYDGR